MDELTLLIDTVRKCTRKTATKSLTNWPSVAKIMNGLTGKNKTDEQWRHTYRKVCDPKYQSNSAKISVHTSMSRTNAKGIDQSEPKDIIKNELRNLRTLDQLVYASKLSELEVLGIIELLKRDGYEVSGSRVDGKLAYVLNRTVETTYHEYKRYYTVNKTFKIGLVSDSHIGSRFWQKSHLDAAYEHMRELGVTDVYHSGDISDGFYPGRMAEVYVYGADEQVDEIVRKYPKIEGMTTRFITGNHDETHMRNGGTNIGRSIAGQRDDMIYMGHNYAKVWLSESGEQRGVDMDLIHPGDGTSYALSYQLQKRVNNMSGGEKPKILVTGHYHKYFVMFYRNVICISLPSFQAQSGWMRGKGIQSDMGYVVAEITINEHNDIIQFNHQFFPFFNEIRNNY